MSDTTIIFNSVAINAGKLGYQKMHWAQISDLRPNYEKIHVVSEKSFLLLIISRALT